MSFPNSGFTAVPNPMMLSFLATQGFAIMYYGGAGWQFGKRKVSGMSNEEINKMSPNEFLMKLHSETKTMVPTMSQGMKDMTPLIRTTMIEFGAYVREAIQAVGPMVANIFRDPQQTSFSPLTQVAGSTVTPVRFGSSDRLDVDQAELEKQFNQWLKDQGYTPGGQTQLGPGYVDPQIKKKLADAKRKQEKLERDARNQRAKDILALKKKPILPQLSIQGQARFAKNLKRKAGQSQKMERLKLIREIRDLGTKIKNWRLGTQGTKGYGAQLRLRRPFVNRLRAKTLALTNLLARYRF